MVKEQRLSFPILLTVLVTALALLLIAGCSREDGITNSSNAISNVSGETTGGNDSANPQPNSDYSYDDVEGYVSMIDYGNMTFEIMGDYYYADQHTVISIDDCYMPYPTFGEIREGDYVKVKFATEMGSMGYYAAEIQVVRDFDYYSVEGYVTMVDHDGSRIQVMDQYYWVDGCTGFDIDDCYLEYPGITEVYEGDYVKIEYRSEMDDNGYYARKVQVIRSYDYYDVMGMVQAIDYQNGTFQIMEQTYWIDGCTGIDFENHGYGNFDQIYVGDYVKVEYRSDMTDMGYYAKLVVVERDYDYYEVMGYVEMIDYENMTVQVMGEYYIVDGFTQIDISDCSLDYPTLNEIYEGDYVKIEYRMDMNGSYAGKIQVESDHDYYDVTGTVESIDYDAMTFQIMGQSYWVNACTELDLNSYNFDDFSTIEEGDQIKIEYRTEMDDQGYYVRKIQLLYDMNFYGESN